MFLLFSAIHGKITITKICVKKKAKIRNRYNQVPHLTRATIWEKQKHKETSHTIEQRGQSFPSRRPQGCKEQTRPQNTVSKWAHILSMLVSDNYAKQNNNNDLEYDSK